MDREPWRWTLEDVRRLLNETELEGLYLEFKGGGALDATEKAKGDIGKDVSSFANAGGGTIIYGVEETPGFGFQAVGLEFRHDHQDWLDQVIQTRIQPRISGLRITPLMLENGRVLYVVWVPQSERAPHQAHDKRFYTRRNGRSEAMEEYEIRDVLQRRRAPDVLVSLFFRRHGARIEKFPIDWSNPSTVHGLEVNGEISNVGGGEIRDVLLTLLIDDRLLTTTRVRDNHFRRLSMRIGGEPAEVGRLHYHWRDPNGLPLFRTVNHRLLPKDLPISFTKSMVEGEHPPFILWETRTAGMDPRRGAYWLRRTGDAVCLESDSVPEISDVAQDGRGRSILENPDLSYWPG